MKRALTVPSMLLVLLPTCAEDPGEGWCNRDLPARHQIAHEDSELRFGSGLAGLGDFDGDGRVDLAMSGPNGYDGGAGRAWIITDAPLPLPTTPEGFVEAGAAIEVLAESGGQHIGERLYAAGDFDGDGLGDLLIPASEACGIADPEACPEPPLEGPVPPECEYVCEGAPTGSYLVLGRAAHQPIALEEVRAGMGGTFFPAPDASIWERPRRVAGNLDMDGDGRDDLAMAGYGNGEITVIRGHSPTGPIADADVGTSVSGFHLIPGPDNSTEMGEAIAAAGDVNGDGLDDLLLSDTSYGASGLGRAYLIFGPGPTSGEAEPDALVAQGQGLTFDGQSAGDAMVGIGDMDGDGFDDIAILASKLSVNGQQVGRLYLVRGGPDASSLALADLQGGTPQGTVVDSGAWRFSEVLAAPGDFDGDGLSDLLVEGWTNLGYALYVVRGGPLDEPLVLGQGPRTLDITHPYDESWSYPRLRPESALGDIDCDGRSEFGLGYGPLTLVLDPLGL
ncbi:MAG: FG-GAP repeat protein [Myxococcales bacterium]|nr:FG-GAP repeat protein [Myxococcales bacterium]